MKMHNPFMVLFLIGISITFHGQIKNIPVTSDSSVIVDEVYAGMLAWNETRVDSFSNQPKVTVRFGTAATWNITKRLSFNIFGVYEVGTGTPFLLTQCRFDYHPTTKWKLSVGNMATPMTELRPYPVSTGHFETWTLARIPGLAPGIKIRVTSSSSFSVATGIALRQHYPEYHLSVTSSPVTAAVYYRPHTNALGVATKLQTKHFFSIAVFNNNTIGNTSMYSFKSYSVYNDSGYDFEKKQIIRWETGLLKNFKGKWLSGLVGFGFDSKACSLNSYIFVHL